MADIENPLSETDLQLIIDTQEKITKAENLIRKMKNVGIDVSNDEAHLSELRKKLVAIKANFFPNR